MSLHDTDIQGNSNVSRNVNVGGHANVHGDVTVNHNLVVKGWVDAPNIKGPLKGLYASEDALNSAYPRPMPGWFALVGNTLPADVYRAERGKWIPTGEKGGEFNLWLDQLETDVKDLNGEIKATQRSLEAETAERTAADTALGKRIDNEATTRAEADSALGTRLTIVEAKTSTMVLCDGILDVTDTPRMPGLYLQRDSDGDLIQIVSVTGDGIDRSIAMEGKIYVCGGLAYQFNGIVLEPMGHSEFIFDGGDAFAQFPDPSPEIGGGSPDTDYTIAKLYDGKGARLN